MYNIYNIHYTLYTVQCTLYIVHSCSKEVSPGVFIYNTAMEKWIQVITFTCYKAVVCCACILRADWMVFPLLKFDWLPPLVELVVTATA